MSTQTYRGVPVPERIQRDRTENGRYAAVFAAWREGVDDALGMMRPMVEALRFDSLCSFDHHGYCQEHGHLEPGPCPDGAARALLEATEKDGAT